MARVAQVRLWREASGRSSIAPRRGWRGPQAQTPLQRLKWNREQQTWNPHLPVYLQASMRWGFTHFRVWTWLSKVESAVDPCVRRLDKIEQISVHLPRVGQHQHVGYAGACASHAGF